MSRNLSLVNSYVSDYLLIGLVFSEYLLSGLVPSVKEVNDEEPLFPAAILNLKAAYEVSLLSLLLVS